MTSITDMLAFLEAAQPPANEGTSCAAPTLFDTLKRDVESLPRLQPELTPEQQIEQARSNALFVADHLAPGEDKQSFSKLWADFRADFGPTGAIEEELVRHVTSAAWGLRRMDRMEAWHWQQRVQYVHEHSVKDGAQVETYHDISVLLHDATVAATQILQDDFDRIQYFRIIMEKRFDAALKRLQSYRKSTKSKPAKLDPNMLLENEAEHAPMPHVADALSKLAPTQKPPRA